MSSMRLLVVAGSPPESSRSRLEPFEPAKRRIAAQPPGPGLPLQAPSVKISTCGLSVTTRRSQSVILERCHAAVEAELRQVLLRVLAFDQGVGRCVHPVVE